MTIPVEIVATGVLTARGESAEAVLAAIEPAPDARVDLDPDARFPGRNYRPLDRTGQLTVAAVESCLSAVSDRPAPDRTGLVVGTTFGSAATISAFDRRALTAGPMYVKPLDFANSVINAAAGQAAIWHDLQGVNATVCGGTASGLLALLTAADLLHGGRADLVIAGGVEERCEEVDRATATAGWIPVERLGEAAAFFALRRAEGDGAGVRLLGGASRAAPRTDRDPESLARALRRALDAALVEAGLEGPATVRVASTGEASGATTDGVETAELESWRPGVARFAIKATVGECLGASGALQLLPFWAWAGGYAVPGWPEEDGTLLGAVTAVDRHGLAAAAVVEARRGG